MGSARVTPQVPWLRLRGVYTFAAAGHGRREPAQLTGETFVADPPGGRCRSLGGGRDQGIRWADARAGKRSDEFRPQAVRCCSTGAGEACDLFGHPRESGRVRTRTGWLSLTLPLTPTPAQRGCTSVLSGNDCLVGASICGRLADRTPSPRPCVLEDRDVIHNVNTDGFGSLLSWPGNTGRPHLRPGPT